jgi:hypothetical protein
MAEIPQPWRAYALLQESLSRTTTISDRSWGIEAGLNFLITEAALKLPPSDDDIARSVQSESRRERNRLALRRHYISAKEPAIDPVSMLDARSELHLIRSKISDADWRLMASVGIGRYYSEISAVLETSAAAARVRVMRLRQQITAKAA